MLVGSNEPGPWEPRGSCRLPALRCGRLISISRVVNWLLGSSVYLLTFAENHEIVKVTKMSAVNICGSEFLEFVSYQTIKTGAVAVTAGGNHLRFWDMLGGGRLLCQARGFRITVRIVSTMVLLIDYYLINNATVKNLIN